MLAVDSLRRTYGEITALDDMTFAVRPGAVTGFLGPNGAGKTTTMRAIFGLTALDAGTVSWDDRAVDASIRRRFGYLPEERGLYPNMRVGDQLVYLGRLRGLSAAEARRRTESWLDDLGLADRIGDDLEELSLGNQQRVQLIGSLLHEPDVLILDEPFSGLDPVAVDALSKVLRAEARRGATVLFSSHQLDLVEDLCEDAVIVDHGRAIASGPLDDLTAGSDPVLAIDVPSDPDGTWTEALDPSVHRVMSTVNGVVRVALVDGGPVDGKERVGASRVAGDLLATRGATDLAAGNGAAASANGVVERAQPVLDAARAAGAVRRFDVVRRSLAEVFLAIVGHRLDESGGAGDGAEPGSERTR